MRIKVTFLCACALALVAAGCGSDDKSASSDSAPKQQASGPKPTVKFLSPKDGASLNGAVTAKVALTNFQIAPQAVGKAPRPNQGHLHFKMDDGKYDFPKYSGPNGLIGKKLGVTGHYSPALAPKITYKRLPPGKHTLEVYLANNNHTDVGVETKIEFTLK